MDGNAVCIKSLRPEYMGNPIYEALLKKEYETGSSLSHPNICRTLDYRHMEGLGNCIITEWVEGRTLTDLLQNEKLTPALGRKIISELCEALNAMHHMQTVHRDIKPDNILITGNGNNVKVIDFGLADTDSSATLKMAAGTKTYAAPEQMNGSATADCRSDIFAMGKVIGLISGKLPRRYARVYDSIVAKCTENDINRRISDIGSLKHEIHRKERLRRQIPLCLCALAIVSAILLQIFTPAITQLYRQKQVEGIVRSLTEELLETGSPIKNSR